MTNLTIDLLKGTVHVWQQHTNMGTELDEVYTYYKLPEIGLTHYEVKCKDESGNLVYLRLPVRNTNFLIKGVNDEQIREM